MINQLTTAFWLALSFLTRIPTPNLGSLTAADFGRSALFYPLIGLIIGGLLCLPLLLFSHAEPLLVAALITVLSAIITGGLHLDGVADGADAWLGGLGDSEKTHRILKDPLVGAAGAIAIASVLMLKWAALTVLITHNVWWAILFAPVWGRSLVLLLFLTTSYVRAGGLASAVTDQLPRLAAIIIVGLSSVIALGLSWQGLAGSLLIFWLLRRLMLQRLGGCTGDTAGASVEIGELAWLMGIALSL